MQEGTHKFQISAKQLGYLRQLAARDKSLVGLLGLPERLRGSDMSIRLGRAEAEQLRDYLTTQLATAGFDNSYSLNEEGDMLETLIDKFFHR